jgi:hypothetical protein
MKICVAVKREQRYQIVRPATAMPGPSNSVTFPAMTKQLSALLRVAVAATMLLEAAPPGAS